MDSLTLSLEAVTPIFLMMLLGYVLKGIHFVDEKVFDAINKLVFKVFLPVLLFNNIYKTKSAEGFGIAADLFGFTTVCVLCVFALGLLAVYFITKDNAKRGVILQGFFRTNFAILGVPLVSYICGDNTTGLSSLMVALVVPLFNVLGVISLELFKGGNIHFKKILKGIVTNPLIIGCVAGMVFLLFKIELPQVLEKTVSDIAHVSSPLALVVLGAGFTFTSIKGYVKENVIILLARLVVLPAIILSIAAYLGFHGEAFACLLVTFGGPIAVSSFSMAQQMGGDKTLAGQLVVLTSAFCILTLFVWIFVFGSFGII
ncbi:MAG: AEC family transporter [Clostridia bacterium]|nr:AEC family transporter [Clostridia bacterium]